MFRVLYDVLPRDEVERIGQLFWNEHKRGKAFPGQTGIRLDPYENQLDVLRSLEDKASHHTGSPVKLKLEQSSCRLQTPDGKGQLRLHQDRVALGVKSGSHPACIIWLPLCDIDEETPTLDVCPVYVADFLPHKTDASKYSVLKVDPILIDMPLLSVSRMRMGHALWMRSTTIHCTSVRPWHKKSRISLDLRFLP